MLVFLLSVAVTIGCSKSENGEGLSELTRELKKTIENAKEKISPYTEDVESTASEEISKLLTVEYKVVKIPLSTPPEELTEELTELGKERWECFHVEQHLDTRQIYCRRRPKSYLRYIMRAFK